jgi:hypothetical protein
MAGELPRFDEAGPTKRRRCMGRWHGVRSKGLPVAIVGATLSMAFASCSVGGSPLSEDDFEPGVCRDSAQSVIAIDDAVRQLDEDEKAPTEVVDTLKQSQTRLRETREGADEELRARLSALTNAIGAFRIGIDAGTAGPEQTQAVDTALQGVIDRCTTS